MRTIIFIALIVLTFSGASCSQNDTKGHANLPGGKGSSEEKTADRSQKTVNVPNVVGKTLAEAIGILDSVGFKVNMAGTGSVIKQQAPPAHSQAAVGSTVMLTR